MEWRGREEKPNRPISRAFKMARHPTRPTSGAWLAPQRGRGELAEIQSVPLRQEGRSEHNRLGLGHAWE